MVWQVLIAHAEKEVHLAEELASPLQTAGYVVAHRGTVFVGESIVAEASKVLSLGGPVVLCGTVEAMGTGWAHRIVNAANRHMNVRVFAVQMEERAYLEPLASESVIARYYEDPNKAINELIAALQKYYPLFPSNSGPSSASSAYRYAHEEFLNQKQRVERRIKENNGQ